METISKTQSDKRIFKPYKIPNELITSSIEKNEIKYQIYFKPSIILSNVSSDESETLSNSENHSIKDYFLNQKRNKKQTLFSKCIKCKIEDCESLFENEIELQKHMLKIHKKTFKCNFQNCTKEYMIEKNYNKHSKIHLSIIKKYICPFPGCNKRFTASYNQKIHYRIHTGERPYKCDKCNNEYYDRANYKYHLRTAHLNLNYKDTICTHLNCNHEFKTKKQKIMHHDKLECECRKEKNYLFRLLTSFKDCIDNIISIDEVCKFKEMEDVEKQLKFTKNAINDEEQFNAIFLDKYNKA